MTINLKHRCLTAALLLGGSLAAQTNQLLNWEQCLERTASLNPDLISAKAAVRELEHQVASASSGFFPQVSASASVNKSGNKRNSDWTEQDRSSVGLSLSQSIYSGGEHTARRARALVALDIGKEQLRNTLSDVEKRTRLAFIDALYVRELIDLTATIAERRANNVRLIQLRFDSGRENAGSLARSKAQLAEARYEEREAKRAHDVALKNLAAAIGQIAPINGVTGGLTVPEPAPLDHLKQLTKQTPNYRIAELQVESSRQGLTVTQSDRFPTIRFTASTGLSGEQDLDDESWSFGVSASVPLFTGKRNLSDVLAANEKVIQSEMSLLDTFNTLTASLQGSWNDYTDAVDNEAVQQTLLDAERLRAEISTAKYKQGLLDYEDWDTIESNLITQNKRYLDRRRATAIQQANWRNALGRSVWDE